MMKKLYTVFIAIVLALLPVATVWGQDCISLVRIKGDEQYLGKVLSSSDQELIIQSAFLGKITIPRKEIKSQLCLDTNYFVTIQLKDQTKLTGVFFNIDSTGLYLREPKIQSNKVDLFAISSMQFTRRVTGVETEVSNPNSTRYFFAPSAIPIEKGEGYYQNAYLLMNSANFGITKNLSLGGGIVIPILFYVTPKISFKVSKNFYAGAGAIYTTTFIPGMNFGAGIPYGLVTYGNNERNITIGSGYGLLWLDGDMTTTNYPITTVNAMYRISRKIQLVSENWIIPFKAKVYEDIETTDAFGNPIWEERYLGEQEKFYMAFALGSRFLFSEKSSVDFSPVLLFIEDEIVVLPYLDFVYKF